MLTENHSVFINIKALNAMVKQLLFLFNIIALEKTEATEVNQAT